MKRLVAVTTAFWLLACGTGPQEDADPTNDQPPDEFVTLDVVTDDCGLGALALDGPYQRAARGDGGFTLTWDGGAAWGFNPQPTYTCETSGYDFACWPVRLGAPPEGGPLPGVTTAWLRGKQRGDTLVGEIQLHVSCDGSDPVCVAGDTATEVLAPCDTVLEVEVTPATVQRPGRCPDDPNVPVTEPAVVMIYNYTGKDQFAQYTSPDGPMVWGINAAIGPSQLFAWRGGYLSFYDDDGNCRSAVEIDDDVVYVELRSDP